MTRDADVLVVGAGIIGCAVARELARRGLGVDVVDTRDVGAGATQASAGVLAPYIEAHEGGALLDLTVRSLGLYAGWMDDLRAETGMDVEYGRAGTVEIALDDHAAVRLQAMVQRFGSRASLEWLDRDAARAAEPALSAAILGALSVPDHGYVVAPQLTAALARSAAGYEARFHSGVRVSRLVGVDDHVEVTTDDGVEWRAKRVVIAAGSWAGGIEGLREPAAQDVRPVRGQILRVAWRGRPLSRVLWGPACYLVPWHDGTVLVGATMEDAGFEERTTAAGVRDLLSAACELLPAMADATFLEARSGLRPATSDGLPIIGPSAVSSRVVYATGHYRNGILLAPLTALLVADVLLDGGTDPALEVLTPSRVGPVGLLIE